MKRPAFFLCYFETTRNCDQDCPNCMTRLTTEPARTELTTDEAKRLVLDELLAVCPNGAVSFSGGEILQRPDHLELIEHNARNGLYTFVNTSGASLDAARLRALKNAAAGRLTMGFSLDSVDSSVQAKCRSGGQEQFTRLTRLCDEHQVSYFVLVTISRRNMHTLQPTLAWLNERKIAVIRSPFVPRGAAASSRDLCFDAADMERHISPALRNHPLSYVSFTPFFAAPDATHLNVLGQSLSLGSLGCQAGRTFIGINAEGDVAPCVHLLDTPVCCGNVREQPLSRIIEESPIMRTLRSPRPVGGKCSRCRYGDSCRGCRSLAYYHSGDYLAEDPTCFFMPETVETRSIHEDLQTRNTRVFLDHLVNHRPWSDIFGSGGRLGVALLNLKARFMERVESWLL
ncbi:MAG: radical SAM protein [Vicinamibacteria bacterium]|nr:radical SAM protein [Vicinamibacteria bacterium]